MNYPLARILSPRVSFAHSAFASLGVAYLGETSERVAGSAHLSPVMLLAYPFIRTLRPSINESHKMTYVLCCGCKVMCPTSA